MLDQITPVILTYNEAANIRRTLSALGWARRIVVVDSFSNDQTEAICAEFDKVDFVQRSFDQHAVQWNFGLAQNIDTRWTLALDADHVLSDAIIEELNQLQPPDSINGYWASFSYKIDGRVLTQSLYPPLISLYRTGLGHYQQDGHTQRLAITGELGELSAKIYHDDRKSTRRWLRSQWNYAIQEADKLKAQPWSSLAMADKIRKSGLAPIAVIPYTLIMKGLLFSGLPGLKYSLQRFVAELYLQIARLRRAFGGA